LIFPILCDSEENIYNYNKRKSFSLYRSSLANLFCVSFDNSGVKGNFYTEVELDETAVKLLMDEYIQNDFNSIYYKSVTETGLILNNEKYNAGDYLRIHQNPLSPYVLEGKFLIEAAGPNGECIKNRPVKFMINNPNENCGIKLVIITNNYYLLFNIFYLNI
jgi:hypothetical protein